MTSGARSATRMAPPDRGITDATGSRSADALAAQATDPVPDLPDRPDSPPRWPRRGRSRQRLRPSGASIAGPGPGWAPAAAAASADPHRLVARRIAVLGACGLAGFLLLLPGRRRISTSPWARPRHRLTWRRSSDRTSDGGRAGSRASRSLSVAYPTGPPRGSRARSGSSGSTTRRRLRRNPTHVMDIAYRG